MYKACIFDLDGTLTDTLESLTCSVNTMLGEMGLASITADECRAFVGNGARKLVEKSIRATGDPEATRLEEAVEIYGRVFQKLCTYHVKPYEGIVELLELLKSHKIDFVIDSEPIKAIDKEMTVKHIKKISNCFVASESYDTSHIKTIKDLANEPLILPIKGTANRNNLEEFFIKNDCTISNVLNIHTSEVIIGAIKRNLGVGYVIKDLVTDDIKRGLLKEIPIPNLPKVGISLVYIKDYF